MDKVYFRRAPDLVRAGARSAWAWRARIAQTVTEGSDGMAGAGVRWFVGIPVPIDAALELAGRAANAPVPMDRARLLAAEDLHLTLRFFGEIAEARVAALRAALALLRHESFGVELVGVGAFRSVGALYAAVAPSSELDRLAEAVTETLAWKGFPRELRPFHPHVTLARVRRALPQAELHAWSEHWAPLSFRADRIALFHSRVNNRTGLDGEERRYEVAQTFPLSKLPACGDESL